MTKWRNRMSESDAERLLALTVELGLKTKTISRGDFYRVNVDTTVQEKAVTYPTDSKLIQKTIQNLGKLYGQLKRNYLKGSHGDNLNVLLSSVGCNFRLILNAIRNDR